MTTTTPTGENFKQTISRKFGPMVFFDKQVKLLSKNINTNKSLYSLDEVSIACTYLLTKGVRQYVLPYRKITNKNGL